METTELRLGNYILNPAGYQVQVTHLSFDEDFTEMIKHHKGIALTPEWLTRLGFKLVDETMGSGIEGIKGPYYAHEALLLWSNGSEPKNAYMVHYGHGLFGKYTAVQGRWIRSVHELQNVFHAWKGQELTPNIA